MQLDPDLSHEYVLHVYHYPTCESWRQRASPPHHVGKELGVFVHLYDPLATGESLIGTITLCERPPLLIDTLKRL